MKIEDYELTEDMLKIFHKMSRQLLKMTLIDKTISSSTLNKVTLPLADMNMDQKLTYAKAITPILKTCKTEDEILDLMAEILSGP